ncbi:MAG: hypothetical protein J6D23_02840 [Clostridia bacterium]|nr:hypothetical protein [Clostridia bacterium]
MKKYIYNTKTHILHIEGLCPNANYFPSSSNLKIFSSEDEALAFDGRAVSICKKCHKKRDELIFKS